MLRKNDDFLVALTPLLMSESHLLHLGKSWTQSDVETAGTAVPSCKTIVVRGNSYILWSDGWLSARRQEVTWVKALSVPFSRPFPVEPLSPLSAFPRGFPDALFALGNTASRYTQRFSLSEPPLTHVQSSAKACAA